MTSIQTRTPLKTLVFLGSSRQSWPPKPARLGERVAKFMRSELAKRNHEVVVVDPLRVFNAEMFKDGLIFKPHFAYAKGKAPESIETLARDIEQADSYCMCTPEYNHSFSPALGDLLNHFGSSLFSYKPSLIVSYSMSQWGGTRAAMALRPFLTELGCLPVSQTIHLPRAAQVLDEDGALLSDTDRATWERYCGRGIAQLEWWAEAARLHRSRQHPQEYIESFKSSPSQRNAPR